jgi:hypothetical protein
MSLVSATHRYSARPLGPTRYVPLEPFAVLTVTPVVAATGDVVADAEVVGVGAAAAAAVLELELLALPHPATITAAVASPASPSRRNFAVLRLFMCSLHIQDFSGPLISTVSYEDPGICENLPQLGRENVAPMFAVCFG